MSRVLIVAAVTVYSSDVPLLMQKAFRSLGHEAEIFSVNEDLPLLERIWFRHPLKFNYRLFNARFYRHALEWRPDIVFVYGSNWGIFPDTIERLKKKVGCSVIIWEGNLYLWRWFQSESIPLYDHFFCLDSHVVPLLTSTGHPSVHLLGGCCDPDEHRPMPLADAESRRFGSDVCFVGTPYANRVQLFETLSEHRLHLWGEGWDKVPSLRAFAQVEPVYGLKKTKIYNGSKISINLQSTKYQINGLSVRIFEVAACGGFSITEPKTDLALFFKPGEEIVTFRDSRDLKNKVEYYIAHPEERQQIAAQARKRALAEHTYVHRAQRILDVVSA